METYDLNRIADATDANLSDIVDWSAGQLLRFPLPATDGKTGYTVENAFEFAILKLAAALGWPLREVSLRSTKAVEAMRKGKTDLELSYDRHRTEVLLYPDRYSAQQRLAIRTDPVNQKPEVINLPIDEQFIRLEPIRAKVLAKLQNEF